MSTSPIPSDGAAPPPGCPAHGLDAEGLRRLYGEEAEADPRALYETLRTEHGPVAPVLLPGDLKAWLVLGHRENLDVARTPSRFSRDSRRWSAMREGRLTADHPLAPITLWQPSCIFTDGAEHQRLRGAVTESLERLDRRGVRRYVTRFSHQLIDRFAERGRADLATDFAEQLPMLVMTQLVGMPEEFGPRIVEAARDMLQGTGTAVESNEYILDSLRQLLDRKRETPGRDLTSWLLEHQSNLSDDEIVEHVRLVLVAAFETTANLIASTLRSVLTDQRFRASLSGGHMTLPDALDQVLWDEPPMTAVLGRWATGDTELGGQQIKEGDAVLLGLAAGNADPEVRPDLAKPVRGNRSHLAFSGGPHECPGQDIGRAIAETGIDTLLTRLPDIELAVPADQVPRKASMMSQQMVSMPVAFTPRRSETTGTVTVTAVPKSVPLPAVSPEGRAEGTTSGAPAANRSWWSRILGG
ncbi:cytochrome P450 [Streptomyces cavernicola]|uniref:Cytochrome P450 n=1 Tax=Streptomyces cavernicola TaxID=3043613 RepID=A0ABT6S826_9ACTN|nr:cytochrome P450 [Streptomyces sp. B-S-A6]MDI3404252.1 cytochrome P450 [Streptomyces sp. B-S-A6]